MKVCLNILFADAKGRHRNQIVTQLS